MSDLNQLPPNEYTETLNKILTIAKDSNQAHLARVVQIVNLCEKALGKGEKSSAAPQRNSVQGQDKAKAQGAQKQPLV